MLQETPGPEDYSARLAALHAECTRTGAALAELLATRAWSSSARMKSLCHEMSQRMHKGHHLLLEMQRRIASEKHDAADRDTAVEIERRWHHASVTARDVRAVLNHWPGVQAMVLRQAPPTPVPLYPVAVEDPLIAAQGIATDSLMLTLHAMFGAGAQADVARDYGCYNDIPMEHSMFLAQAHAAYRVLLALGRTERSRFLDVGCGGGMKVLTATRFYDGADGLEFDPNHAAAARALVSHAPAMDMQIHEADALSFQDYGRYDVIYAFRPFKDDSMALRMEQRIIDSVAPGTVLLLPRAAGPPSGCVCIEGSLYVAGLSESDGRELKAQAERMGTTIPAHPAPVVSAPWRPIVQAARNNGYSISI